MFRLLGIVLLSITIAACGVRGALKSPSEIKAAQEKKQQKEKSE